MTHQVVVTVALACVLIAPAVLAQATDDHFKDGLTARNARRWQQVAERMREAIKEDGQESTRKVGERLGGILGGGMEYLPHYFLGEALFNLDNCLGAVEAWAESERQGPVSRRADFASRIRQGYTACEGRGVMPPDKFGPTLQRTTQQVTEASAAVTAVAAAGQVNLEVWRAEDMFREQYDRLLADVQLARAKLATAGRDRSSRDFAEAATAAERARVSAAALETSLAAAISARAAVSRQARDVEQQIASAEALERSLEGRSMTAGNLTALNQQGREALSRARERLAAGGRGGGAKVLEEARALALDAAAKFRSVLDELDRSQKGQQDRRLASSLQASREAFSFVDGGFATFDRLASQRVTGVTAEMRQRRQEIKQQTDAARRRLEAASRTQDVAGIEAATKAAVGARSGLDALISSFGPPTLVDRGVHPALEEGASLFLRGDYQGAVSSLSAERLSGDVPLRLHVHLFRAASLFALFVRSGGSDQSLRARAQQEVELCKQLDPGFVPDTRVFSPRFLAFFRGDAENAPPVQR